MNYDYIIIGSGTAGSLVANRLSADSQNNVLVIEAGGKDNNLWLKLPVGFYKAIPNQNVSHWYMTETNKAMTGRQIPLPRGRVLGGSSSINGLVFIRGQHDDFDDWQKMGADGWDYESVLPHFRKFESYQGAPSQFRGQMGELSVQEQNYKNPVCETWIESMQNLGYPLNPDFNSESTYGVGYYQASIRGRWRDSGATAFLKPALKRDNLNIITHARVSKIIIENKKAIGVEIIHNNTTQRIFANKEVILCAGAVQSPQILELSGIGQKQRLQKLGIPVVHHAPEVGENLQDHLHMRTVIRLKGKGSLNSAVNNPLAWMKMGWDWLFHNSGALTMAVSQVGGAVCSKYAKNNRPDLQLFVMPLSMGKPGEMDSFAGFTTSVWQCHPNSRGSIHIRDNSPFSDPIINPNYLTDKHDCNVMVEGVKIIRKIYQQPNFKKLWDMEMVPGIECQSDAELLASIRQHATTVHHVVGTCRMGNDKTAVVDSRLRVNGIKNLRVIDASVMPKITSANTNAPTYMIAEKGAFMILEDNPKK